MFGEQRVQTVQGRTGDHFKAIIRFDGEKNKTFGQNARQRQNTVALLPAGGAVTFISVGL